MIEFLFLDLDDTILDFHKAERIALSKTLKAFGIEPTEHVLGRYHVLNKACWERLEKGELIEVNPYWSHSYGTFVPELVQIDKQLREALFGGEE